MTDPESETSRTATYDSKSDIWSIGITAIEIAEKNPPLSDIHPMRALVLIPNANLNFAKPKNFSKIFQQFVNDCLQKDPKARPSCQELLEHPFLSKAKSLPRKQMIYDIIQKVKFAKEKGKAGVEDDDDDATDDRKKPQVPQKVVSDTIRIAKLAQEAASSPAPTVRVYEIVISSQKYFA